MKELPYKDLKPDEIEKKSMEIIGEELAGMGILLDDEISAVVKRAIHTTADFDYAHNLCFSDDAVRLMKEAIRGGACIVTDTQMAKAGINRKILGGFGGDIFCFMSDEDIAKNTGIP